MSIDESEPSPSPPPPDPLMSPFGFGLPDISGISPEDMLSAHPAPQRVVSSGNRALAQKVAPKGETAEDWAEF